MLVIHNPTESSYEKVYAYLNKNSILIKMKNSLELQNIAPEIFFQIYSTFLSESF